MKRIITSLKNVNKDVMNFLLKEFPNGVDDAEFVNFPTSGGGFLKALELQLNDCLYLIKMDDESYYQKFHAKEGSVEESKPDAEIEEIEGDQDEKK